MKVIAMIPHYWGRGESVFEAVQQLKKAAYGVNAGTKIILYGFIGEGDVWVNDMGGLSYKWTDEEVELPKDQRPYSFQIGQGTIRGNSITFTKTK